MTTKNTTIDQINERLAASGRRIVPGPASLSEPGFCLVPREANEYSLGKGKRVRGYEVLAHFATLEEVLAHLLH